MSSISGSGLPKKAVSNRGPQFIAEFMKEFYQLLEIKLAATTACHPQGDGQTDRINQELEQYLWLFVNQRQDDWVGLLPFMEFQYNNHVHSPTQQPPFLLDTRQVPRMGFEPGQWRSHLELVNEFKEHMEGALEEAKATLAKSKDNMTEYYNQRWTPTPHYKQGDKVCLDASDMQTSRHLRKLSHCRLGPFPIVKKFGNGAYQLRLPPSMSSLHPAFNVVKLTPAPVDPIEGHHLCPPPLPDIIDREEQWVVEEVLDSKMMNQKSCYLVKWEGFRIEYNSWEPWDNIHAPELVTDFHQRHPAAPHPIRTVIFDSIPFCPSSPFAMLECHSLEGGGRCQGSTPYSTSHPWLLQPLLRHFL